MRQIHDTSKHAMGLLTCGTQDLKAYKYFLGDLINKFTLIKDSHKKTVPRNSAVI